VLQAIEDMPGTALVVKLHPYEDDGIAATVVAAARTPAVVVREFDLYQLVAAADVVLTGHSTVGLEAMTFDRDVIVVNFSSGPDLMPYAPAGAALRATSLDELRDALRLLFEDAAVRQSLAEARERFVCHVVGRLDGRASKRIAEVALGLAERR
jgi:CDP-glycerol glycerophosphotransferase (TagB/SpsB family)